jgi:hypothetical protein
MEAPRRNGDPEGLLVCDCENAPSMAEPVPHFEADVKSYRDLASADSPPNRAIRYNAVFEVGYGFGDASGKYFVTLILLNGEVQWLSGQWTENYEADSSN